jgi:hypothetical protein
VGKCYIAGKATGDNIIWLIRLACWKTKATNKNSEHVILIASHGKSGYAYAPLCCVYTYVACPVNIYI